MEFENSSLFREVQAILNSPVKAVHHTLRADLHFPNNETIAAFKVISVDVVGDYENNFADQLFITLALPAGTYAKRVYPNQSNMDITLYRIPLGEVSDATDEQQAPQSERFTATLLDKGNPLLENNTPFAASEETLNLTGILEIQFQLVNKALEQLRMITLGGIYRNQTPEEVVRGVLTQASQQIKVEGVRLPQGVDMVEPNNTTRRDHYVIPDGTRLVDIPMHVQNRCGGIYSAGLGYYLQGDHWYVYPCFDPRRFAQASRKLTVINVPPNKFPSVERTFRQDGSNLVVMATGEVRFRDDSDSKQLNEGNGVRFADARKFMTGFAQTMDNKTVLSRGANATEAVGLKRPNGNNNVQMAREGISANPFVQYSRLARRQGSFLTFVWENSQPELIFPGMMTQVLYLKEEETRTLFGVVLKVHHYTAMRGQGLTAARYQNLSSVSLFVEHKDE